VKRLHPTAIIDPRAELGEGVEVGPYALIGPDVTVGEGTRIGPHANIQGLTTIGQECQIFFGAAVGFPPQDLKYRGEKTALEIGDRNVIREFTALNKGTAASGSTRIGSDNLLMAYVHVAHDCVIGNHNVLANAAQLAGHVTIGDHTVIGGLVPIHQFVRVGSYAFIGGAFRAMRDVPPYMKAAGSPLRLYGLNHVGLRRCNFDPETIAVLKRAYRLLSRSRLNTSHALERISEDLPQIPEIQHLVSFVRDTKRGIVK
jgi:UDP-N-acetylglucosamine acyltransferase